MQTKELEQFKNKELTIDFVEVKVFNKRKTYTGKGFITQDKDGKLKLKVFCRNKTNFEESIFGGTDITSEVGELLKGDDYFSLSAKDLRGNIWKADRLLINTDVGVDGSIIARSKIHELTSIQDYPVDAKKVNDFLIYPYSGKYPVNMVTHSQETSIRGTTRGFETNMAEYKIKSASVIAKQTKDFLEITVENKNVKDNISNNHITEALEFILAKPMHLIYSQRIVGNRKIIRLRSFDNYQSRTIFQPPISISSIEFKSVNLLFKKYLEHIAKLKKDSFHPIASFIHSVIQAGEGSIEALGLTLAVTIEGMINSEFTKLKTPKDISVKEKEDILNYIIAGKFPSRIEERLKGMIENIDQTRAKDKLYKLQKNGIIQADEIKAWDKLRNPAVHPNKNKPKEINEYKDQIDRATVLLYKLIFLKIGYTGKFQNYSVKGWKSDEFSGSL